MSSILNKLAWLFIKTTVNIDDLIKPPRQLYVGADESKFSRSTGDGGELGESLMRGRMENGRTL